MSPKPKVYLLVLSGLQHDAVAFARRRYPTCEVVILSKSELRECEWKNKLRILRHLKGEALLIFVDSLESLQEATLLKWTVLVHRCRETILADSSGSFEVVTRIGVLGLLPRTLFAALADAIGLTCAWIGLQLFLLWLKLGSEPVPRPGSLDIAFLDLSTGSLDAPGGAHTHITGFLSGVVQEGARAEALSGRPLETVCRVHQVRGSSRFHLFRETAALSLNFQFSAAARKLLAQKRPRLLYQRHGRFVFAGAVLSRLMRAPLVLEYNASEDWMAKYWDPARFAPWLKLCEKISIEAASLIVVVSNPLKKQLMEVGVPPERILVNPNAVDPERFHPECGGAKLRQELGFQPSDTVICFVGTFSYWHGVAVLEQAIQSLLSKPQRGKRSMKFLLVGDGPLAPRLREALEPYTRNGSVVFTGAIPHVSVRAYLDAADILVSPHIPTPDGSPFFGSPTKLFEYMAMGKAIAASALDQIAEVLEHERTALLVKPGDPQELTAAIQRLAADPRLRIELGRNSREAALSRHTWRQNARRVLEYPVNGFLASSDSSPRGVVVSGSSQPGSANLAKQNL